MSAQSCYHHTSYIIHCLGQAFSVIFIIVNHKHHNNQRSFSKSAFMGIEKDIHQVHFVSDKQKALINLLYTYGWVIEKIKNSLSKDDITHQQYNILRILRGS